jgi:predicted dehydrogenase
MEVNKADGMNYAPKSLKKRDNILKSGTLNFAVIGLDHGHIHAITQGLIEVGATPTYVYDDDKQKAKEFCEKHHFMGIVEDIDSILNDKSISLVASAIRPDKRASLGISVLKSGKDYFVDKPGALKKEEVELISKTCESTNQKYIVYFGERIHVEGAVYAQQLIKDGKIGRVLSIDILAPHRLSKKSRPDWFFDKELNGGIIQDIGSHQMEQFLAYSGAKTARVTHSAIANYANKEKKNFYDYGEFSIICDNGTTGYCRLDWFTPDGMRVWGDGRVFIVGEKGCIEIRKYVDVGNYSTDDGDIVLFVDNEGEHRIECRGKLGFPFFENIVKDIIDRKENEISQSHILESMRLTIMAQESAEIIEN